MRLLEIRVMRGCAALLLMIQALGGGAVSLAHARDVVQAPPAFEATHDGTCPILHNGPGCALCQYAGARVVTHEVVELLTPPPARVLIAADRLVVAVASDVRRTPPSRAPPSFTS
jgi:hypothetical protein